MRQRALFCVSRKHKGSFIVFIAPLPHFALTNMAGAVFEV
jgi:hypothetical protein